MLGQRPDFVAEAVAKELSKKQKRSQIDSLRGMHVHALSGYVNITLPPAYFEYASERTIEWLSATKLQRKNDYHTDILVWGPGVSTYVEERATEQLQRTLRSALSASFSSVQSKWYLPDITESLDILKDDKVAGFTQQRILTSTNRNSTTSVVDVALFQKLQKQHLQRCRQQSKEYAFDEIVSESAITRDVQKWLDTISTRSTLGNYTANTQDAAIFYQGKVGFYAPLRSSKAGLYPNAYVAYLLEKWLQNNKTSQTESCLITFMPVRYHELIQSFIDDMRHQGISHRLYYLPISGSRQQLDEVKSTFTTTKHAFQKIANAIEYGMRQQVFLHSAQRQKLLALIDLPAELQVIVTNGDPSMILTEIKKAVNIAEEIY